MKNKKLGVIVIICCLVAIILGLVGYIIFDKIIYKDEKVANNEIIEDSNNNVFKIKLDNQNDIYYCSQGTEVCSTFEYEEVTEPIYNIEVSNKKVNIKYNDKKIIVYIDDKKVYEVESNYSTITLLQKYNNYLIVQISCLCDDPEVHRISINLETKTVEETYCLPEEDGKCVGYKYDVKENRLYNESKYSADYNNNKFELVSQEEIDCAEFDYDLYESSVCTDNEDCARRLQFCSPQG